MESDPGADDSDSVLTGQAARERAELIDWLLVNGFSAERIGAAFVPALLPAHRFIGDDGTRATLAEVAESSGVPEDLLRRLHRAVGLPSSEGPDAPALSRADAEAVVRAKAFLDMGFDADEVVAVVRVLAEGLGRAAEAMRMAALRAVLRPGSTELQLARAFEHLGAELTPVVGPMITDLLYMQLRHSFETEAVSLAERATGSLPGAGRVAVAFADLVGFTELGETVPPELLERTANRLTELAHDVVSAPVRYVKSIGDAVMFVSSHSGDLLDVVMDLMIRAAALDLPRLRVGIASGWAVSHAGDWYGHPVNLASRLAGAARPGVVVTDEEVAADLAWRGDLAWTPLGAYPLKGVNGDVRLTSVIRRSSLEH
jgi:adenylate cyclase